jgi:hypothetical protein
MAKAKVRQILPHLLSAPRPVRFSHPLSVSLTVFATLRNSVIFLVAVCCALTLGNPAKVWAPPKQNYGGMRARYVVLALGKTGSPRKLGVKAEELSKVMYRLIEADH